ncbi:twin-arginine translocase subunit TatC [Halorientalis marina]|jgi:sec-independent protein translocase protein TatC|uniref:twin-arginine translocase subunit TatC n=1 Tax=Halorientalis marina TaxID=2931976 RepID=UPI001FF2C7BA|nr:twin-arginine translocase subunit TatC [Halorientalis marina]
MSGAIDDDTRRAVASGRETAGAMLRSAQQDLQKVFIVAVLGLVGTIWFLRKFGWDLLKNDLFARLSADHPEAFAETEVVAITPFDVILLQVKIGIAVAVLLAIPLFIWYSRDALRARGYWPGEAVARWKVATVLLLSLVLGTGGLLYAYTLFFPIMFDFLATNAWQVGFKPTYSIVKWAEFIFLLTLSFTLAAQLPLVMSALSYAGIVPYETFRDKWRYAVLGIFLFGALFSPPDPFTQIMWAVPLIALYGFSLQMAKLVTIAKRSSEQVSVPAVARDRWNLLAGVAFLSGVGVYAFYTRGGLAALNGAVASLPGWARIGPFRHVGTILGLPDQTAAALVAVLVAALAVGVALFALVARALGEADRETHGPAPASAGDPADIDLSTLDAAGVRAAPPQVFAEMSEDEAVAKAGAAMEADQPGKAEAILDRFDEVDTQQDAADGEGGDGADADAADDEGGTAQQTAAGMVNAFTEEETTEDDIGGYYYDIAFILESLTSKAFRLVAVFMAVLAVSFGWLYRGGIRRVKDTFFARMPGQLQQDVEIVTLHPVEALIFMIKFSTLLGIVVTLPLLLYYAWPALKERGLVRGDPRVMLVWGVTLLVGIVGGSLLGFFYVAPGIISWLATDALGADMVIAYRINNFGWLVIYTTVGIGLLAEIPVSMLLFHFGGIVSVQRMRAYWRHVVVGIFALSGLFSPRGVFTMLLIALPAAFAYAVGLALLWLITLGGRGGGPGPETDVESEPEQDVPDATAN